MDFPTRLRALRKSKKISQTVLANNIGVALKQVQRYETGQNDPTLPVLLALADFFDVSLDYLVDRSDSDVPFSIHDQWETIFKHRLAELLPIFDPTDLDATCVNVGRLNYILEQDEPLTFQEALDISEEIEVPLDYMLGINNKLEL